jgi:Protein of unknown function (DUF3102)
MGGVTMGMDARIDPCFEEPWQFDYGSVPPSVATFLRGQAERIRHGCTTSIIQAGKALIEAKHHLSHGGFVRWVRSEVGVPVRTAQAYMQVALWAKGKSAAIARLPPSILYVLSGRGTPEAFTAKLLARYEAGEQLGARDVRDELKALRGAKSISANPDMGNIAFAEPTLPEIVVEQANIETRAMVGRVVHILANSLSPMEFEEVRSIMTSKSLLDDPNLARNIATAFLIVRPSLEQGRRLRYEVPVRLGDGKYEAA